MRVVAVEVALSVAWLALLMVMLLLTCEAAAKVPLPAWFALMVQVPAVRMLTVVPLTVQTLVVLEVKATVNIEVDEALTMKLPTGA